MLPCWGATYPLELRAATRVSDENSGLRDSSGGEYAAQMSGLYSVRLERFLRAAKLPAMVEYVCLIFSTLWPFKSCATVRLILVAVKYSGQRTHPCYSAKSAARAASTLLERTWNAWISEYQWFRSRRVKESRDLSAIPRVWKDPERGRWRRSASARIGRFSNAATSRAGLIGSRKCSERSDRCVQHPILAPIAQRVTRKRTRRATHWNRKADEEHRGTTAWPTKSKRDAYCRKRTRYDRPGIVRLCGELRMRTRPRRKLDA